MGTTRQKSSCRNRLQNGPHSLLRMKVGTHTRLCQQDRTQRLTRRNRGCFGWGRYLYPRSVPHVSETLRGRVSEWRTLPLFSLGRRRSRRRRGPAGLRDLFRFCRNLWLYAPHSGLSMRARWGWYHYPRRALCTAEVLGARLSKQLICRFLRLLSSILCAVPFSANMQISLSAISVANAFPPPTTAGLCASSRIASNRTTTVSLGCMDSSSFGCLIVLDSSSTYTTRS